VSHRLIRTSQRLYANSRPLAISQQRKYANQIKPIRQNGHLLLVTLLLANMIVNESLPVISDPILGGGVQSVIVSTVLIVM
jgi:metal transporter CNNM